LIFHAGTKADNGRIVTEGGRVIAVTGKGGTLEEARKRAYASVSEITWDGLYFRKDIGMDLLNYNGI
jgi:phosphoribosylamine--glycine ligase